MGRAGSQLLAKRLDRSRGRLAAAMPVQVCLAREPPLEQGHRSRQAVQAPWKRVTSKGLADYNLDGTARVRWRCCRCPAVLAQCSSAFVAAVVLPVDGGFLAAGTFDNGTTVNVLGRNQASQTEGD